MDVQPNPEHEEEDAPDQGLFKRYPKLGVLLVAGVAYLILIGMCLVVVLLAVRGV